MSPDVPSAVTAGDVVLAHHVERLADPSVQVVREDRRRGRQQLRDGLGKRPDETLDLVLLLRRQTLLPLFGLLLELLGRLLKLRGHVRDERGGVCLGGDRDRKGGDGNGEKSSNMHVSVCDSVGRLRAPARPGGRSVGVRRHAAFLSWVMWIVEIQLSSGHAAGDVVYRIQELATRQ